MSFQLTSTAFRPGQAIPRKYTADGENLSPPLEWTEAPPSTKGFALIVEDPDAPSGIFRHWALLGIPREQRDLVEGAGNHDARSPLHVARNDFGHAHYDGPHPPEGSGPHRYRFRLAALDSDSVEAPLRPKAADFWNVVEGHIIGETELVGVYER